MRKCILRYRPMPARTPTACLVPGIRRTSADRERLSQPPGKDPPTFGAGGSLSLPCTRGPGCPCARCGREPCCSPGTAGRVGTDRTPASHRSSCDRGRYVCADRPRRARSTLRGHSPGPQAAGRSLPRSARTASVGRSGSSAGRPERRWCPPCAGHPATASCCRLSTWPYGADLGDAGAAGRSSPALAASTHRKPPSPSGPYWI